jgi:cytochrome oxidase Cu insertion factor (SCO1/SenC/PrrC family)
MAKKRSTKPKRTMMWVTLSALIFLIVVSLASILDLQQKNLTDMQQFKTDYPRVAEQHVFRSVSMKTAIEKLENDTGVVFIGFKECPWCQYLVEYVDKAAKAEKLHLI